ncbi:TrkH family potassium uptake protein [Acholeplasma equirhinis]|uniref:TrkH family potassium uptake protein n=1 Tax=Acholeplasma equirhinis TaxID=555393 RepID=UPI00197A9973|nr:TrkH family potassium uptake protein [Acholeplasma equirhinis]MBN3490030.1 TrkH family potassium uptake protein [Acholeplasma equirhinis]
MTEEIKTIKGFRLLLGYLGIFISLAGLIQLLALFGLVFNPEESQYLWHFLIPGISSIIIGLLLSLLIRKKHLAKLERFEDAVFLVTMWIVVIFASSIPFMMYGANFTQSVFETTAGFTTTGVSLFDADTLPRIFVLYRSFLMLFGGVGLVLVITSTISDRYGLRLYNAEGHTDNLISNVAKSARLILGIYIGYVLVGTILFMIFGMTLFDAINYSITSVSTGGFAPHKASLGYYNNIGIEIVAMVLMILGSTNFLIHTFIITGKFKKAFKHAEWIVLGIAFLAGVSIITMNLMLSLDWDFLYSLRVASFQFISGITTTGLQIVPSINAFPPLSIGIIILIMIIGGQAGSTTGAMKQGRVALALKSSYWYIRDKMSGRRTVRSNFILRFGNYEKVTDVEIRHNYAFIVLYMIFLFLGSYIFMAHGYGFEDSLFEFASLLGSVGYSTGIVSLSAPAVVLWTGTIGMFVGRLEITVISIALIKIFLNLTRKNIL